MIQDIKNILQVIQLLKTKNLIAAVKNLTGSSSTNQADQFVLAEANNSTPPNPIEKFFNDIEPTLKRLIATSDWRAVHLGKLRNDLVGLNPDTVKLADSLINKIRNANSTFQANTMRDLQAYINALDTYDVSNKIQNHGYVPNRDARKLTGQILAHAVAANGGNALNTICELEKNYTVQEIKQLQNVIGVMKHDNPNYWELARKLMACQAEVDIYNTILDSRNGITNMEDFVCVTHRIAAREYQSDMQNLTDLPRNIDRTSNEFINAEMRIGTAEGKLHAAILLHQLLAPGMFRKQEAK